MNLPVTHRPAGPEIHQLTSFAPIPGHGILPVHAHLVRAEQPLLIDTGLAPQGEGFVAALRELIAPEDLRWIWITHTDPDHMAHFAQILELAPHAQVVTGFLGAAKIGLLRLPTDRVQVLAPGQTLDLGNRQLLAVRPPTYDAPETLAPFETVTRTFFSADSFGALMDAEFEHGAQVDPGARREGMARWIALDAPWMAMVEGAPFREALASLRRLTPQRVLSSHLAIHEGAFDPLLADLEAARIAVRESPAVKLARAA